MQFQIVQGLKCNFKKIQGPRFKFKLIRGPMYKYFRGPNSKFKGLEDQLAKSQKIWSKEVKKVWDIFATLTK